MSFRTIGAAALAIAALTVSAGASWAQPYSLSVAPAKTITIVLNGTLGPVLSGNDPAGLDGKSALVTVTASELLKPFKSTAKSASYHIRAGDIIVDVNGTNYTSTSRSEMIVKLGRKADILTFKAALDIDGFAVKVLDTTALQSGSWTKSVLEHPALFSPSPQNLTEPSSSFSYSVFGETTVLGVTGTASDSDVAN
ncbi:MAG TPA: hypothetical protein VIY09_01700 [Rhizomicrobium sp.]